MLDKDLTLLIVFARLVAVNEYLRERGNEYVCIVLDDVIDALKTVLCNSKQK